MRIATWNVNSIRTRAPRVLSWLEAHDVDVLAVQETKCKPEQFPEDVFRGAGYDVVAHGINQWNGVAFISRLPLTDVSAEFVGQPTFRDVLEPRALGVTVDGVRLYSLYVPNGRTIIDPHFAYKLEWLNALAHNTHEWIAENPTTPLALMGDFNIAPFDTDVWDIELFAGSTHVTPEERAAFQRVLDAGVEDVVRERVPVGYTYWDYQQLRFPRNEGMRIDFILGSPAFAQRVGFAAIDRDERKGKGASDHVPVFVDLV